MKSIVLFLILLTCSYSFDYNYKILDKGISSPQAVCGQNDGQVISPIYDSFEEFTYNPQGYQFAYFKAFYKGVNYENPNFRPNFLIQNDTDDGSAQYIYRYEKVDDNTFLLHMKVFKCGECPPHKFPQQESGLDSYGICYKDFPKIKKIGSSAQEICSKNNGSLAASRTKTVSYYWSKTNFSKKTFYYADVTRSSNTNLINKTVKRPSNQSEPDRKLIKNFEFNEVNYGVNNGTATGKLTYEEFECNCPDGQKEDSYGQCKPINCLPPKVEVQKGICAEANFCPDGAPEKDGSCDRSCESMGMFTVFKDHDGQVFTPLIKSCVNKINCNQLFSDCVTKCGSQTNIKNQTCNEDTGVNSCTCKDDSIDDIVDEETPDETTDAGDSKITNKYLKQIKDEELKQTEHLDEVNSLLYTQNEQGLERNQKLDSIDGKISEANGRLGDIKDSVDGMNDDLGQKLDKIDNSINEQTGKLGDKLDTTNEHLSNIKETNQGLLDKVGGFIDTMMNPDEFINGKLGEVDMEGKMGGYLNSSFSQFQNALGFSNSYGSRPSNITVTLYNKTYTIIDFSVLSPYVGVIRALFLSLAYIFGFLILLKKD